MAPPSPLHSLFDALYIAEHEKLLRFLSQAVSSWETAQDLSQDVWARVYSALRAGRAPSTNPRAWLYTIARNCLADHYRTQARLPTAPLEAARHLPAPSADEATLREQRAQALQSTLAQLPEAQCTAIQAVDLAGATFAELAEETGEKMGTWLSRNFYAKRKLRQLLERLYDDLMDNL